MKLSSPAAEESSSAVSVNGLEASAYEKELLESRAQLEAALKAGRMGSWMLDLGAGLLTASDTCKGNFGRSPGDEFSYKDLAESVHPEDREDWSKNVQEAIAKGSEFEIEYRTIWPDGSLHWIVVRGNCFPGKDGKTATLAGVTVDITGKKLAEQKLNETSKFNQNVLDSLAAHISVVDRDGVITDVNRAWLRFASENGADWTMKGVGVGVNYLEVCRAVTGPDEDDARVICSGIKDVLDGKRDLFTVEYPCHSPRQQRWFLLTVSPLGTGSGAVISHTNITERRLAEVALQQYQERFEIVKDGAEIGFWFCDLPFDELVWDHRVKEHFSLPPDARVTIETFYDRLHPDDRERTRASIEGSIANKTSYDIEYRTLSLEGEVKWIRAIGRTFYDGEGKPIRFDGVTLDITTQKRAEKALRDRELLESAVKLQEAERRRIARDLHDQLGQQLTGLRLTLADLHASSASTPLLREKIERAQENARALDRDVSSLAFELRANMPRENGLPDALKNFVSEWSRNYRIAAEFHAAGPDTQRRLPGEIETHLYRIAQEALNNTTKHSNATKADVMLDLRDNMVRLVVEDDGVGFDIEKRSEVARQKGRGLGLVGMQERVELIGGALEIDSRPGHGTTVFVTVPLAAVKSAKL